MKKILKKILKNYDNGVYREVLCKQGCGMPMYHMNKEMEK